MALKYKTVKNNRAYANTFDKSVSMNIYYIPNSIPLPKLPLNNQMSILPEASANILTKVSIDSLLVNQINLKYKFIEKIVENYLWKYPELLKEMQIYISSILVQYNSNILPNTFEFLDNINFYKDIRIKFQDISKKYNIQNNLGSNERGENRIKAIEKHILCKRQISPTCYLDIGCFDGSITKSIAKHFKLHKLQTHGVDILNYSLDMNQPNYYNDITFTQYDGKILPYSDNSFDLITCLMMLHHIAPENLCILLSEINRVMKPDGIVILREHNVTNFNDGHSLDIMHNFYDYVWNDIGDTHQWKTNYKSHIEWSKLLLDNKFVPHVPANIYMGSSEINDRNPFMIYICSYIKLQNDNLITDLFRILPDNLPRVEYKRRTKEIKTVLHWGQRKLLLTEIEFFTNFFTKIFNVVKENTETPIETPTEKTIYAIYAGAAPGTHILYLSKLFPLIHFELYDPRAFSPNLLKNTEKIKTHMQYFTDETANQWKSEDHPDKILLFISDIRTGDTETQSSKMVEERVSIDHDWQKNWYNIISPEYSMFKFRLPWVIGETEYMDGDIYIQPYPPVTSTETRLIVSKNAKNKLYDNKKYEEQLFHFNTSIRPLQFNNILFNVSKNKKHGLTNNYDGASEVYILENYLEFIKDNLKDNLKDKICNMINEISRELSVSRNLFSQQPIKKNKINVLLKLQKLGYIPNNIELNQKVFDLYVIPRYDFFKSKDLLGLN